MADSLDSVTQSNRQLVSILVNTCNCDQTTLKGISSDKNVEA